MNSLAGIYSGVALRAALSQQYAAGVLSLGKLTLPAPLADTVRNQIKNNQIELLSIELTHIFSLASLLPHHKDPFDRLTKNQALRDS